MTTQPVTITLTPAQMLIGAMTGIMRQVSNLKANRKSAYGHDGLNDWQINIEGCLGEMALACHLGVFWDGKMNDLSPGDVGKVEVRTTAKPNNRLIVHEKDRDDAVFYLLTGINGTYQVRGWINGYDAKRSEFWKDPGTGRPAYFVPQSALINTERG